MAMNAWTQSMEHQCDTPRKFAPKVNILLVDTQPARLLSYEAILGELGENLIKATSGTEALEFLFNDDIAVVLANVSSPGVDGLKLANTVLHHPSLQETAILFIHSTGMSLDDHIKGYQHGAVDYISVPVDPEVLRAKVGFFAELHRKRRQQEALNGELEHRVRERAQELQKRTKLLDLAFEAIRTHNQRWRGPT
jgi:response regulator RpfG family c-di-GMP phosphodiesterase